MADNITYVPVWNPFASAQLDAADRGRGKPGWWAHGAQHVTALVAGAAIATLTQHFAHLSAAVTTGVLLVTVITGGIAMALPRRESGWLLLGVSVGVAAALPSTHSSVATILAALAASVVSWLWAGVAYESRRGTFTDRFWVGLSYAVTWPLALALITM